MKKRSGSPGLFWPMVLLAAAGLWFYGQGTVLDFSGRAGRLESALDEILSGAGLSDVHIRNTVRTERRKNFPLPATWVETEREIYPPAGVNLEALERKVRALCEEQKFVFSSARGPRAPGADAVWECARGGLVYQRLFWFRKRRSFFDDKRKQAPRVALVIDDVGGRPEDPVRLDPFLRLGIPLTFAVLPQERRSRETAEKIHRSGHEVIVHQPMEPEDLEQNFPGKAALLTGMDRRRIADMLEKNIRSVPHALGLSNHMGSRYTASAPDMDALMSVLKTIKAGPADRAFLFFDSYTSAHSQGAAAARKQGVPHLRNDVFLDNEDDLRLIAEQLAVLKKRALKRGTASAIGHIQRNHTAEAIARAVPEFENEGIRFVTLSALASSPEKDRLR